jgi:hypothetical protein
MESFLRSWWSLRWSIHLPTFYGTRGFITVFTRAPPLVPILCKMNLVYTLTSYLINIHYNTIISSTSRRPKWSPFKFSGWNSVWIFPLSHACYMTHRWFHHPNNIWRTAQTVIVGGSWEFFSSPPCPERLWGPHSLISNGYQGLFTCG